MLFLINERTTLYLKCHRARSRGLSFSLLSSSLTRVFAVLRLVVTTATREKLYGSFLAMPLHEDMAPWNLFF